MIVTLLGLVAAILTLEGARRLRQSRLPPRGSSLPLPPGPKPLPLFGNVFQMNKDAPHLTYTEWSKKYGDVVYTRILGQEIIVLNSEQVAIELLEKRSQKYSDRPILSVGEIFDFQWPTSAARYGARFRLHRRLLHQVFNANAAVAYRQRQLQKAYELLTYLLDDPTHYAEHFTTFSAAVVMEVTYGYDIKGKETFVTSMQRATDIFVRVSTPEISALCNMLPFAKILPAWFPGMGFKTNASECRRLVSDALNGPYAWVERRIEEGTAAPSMVSDAIVRYRREDGSIDPVIDQAIKESAGSLYGAAVETTNATLVLFVYLMMNHPEVQRRAQTEIDRVVGRKRLPNFDDRVSLPYVDAVMRETMRWHPILSLIPHSTSEEDIYRGYYIPKDTVIMANFWAMSHNEEKYPNPDMFIPERFLREDGTLTEDKASWVFGFGRRICPGRHVAEVSLWSAMACILTMFKIEKTEGSDNVKWTTGLTIHPLPFPCRFVPRDEATDAQKLSSLIYASHNDS